MYIDKSDIIVIGAGHAGCEAALAAARLGCSTILFAINLDSVAMMPCNPSIGGTSKGHLVREIDALGGEMGKIIDKTYLQSKMLNTSKGPAVHSLRAQADKHKYSEVMKLTIENTPNLKLKQAEVTDILVDENKNICGIKTSTNAKYQCKSIIITTGTYLKAECIIGDLKENTGPNGLKAANNLSNSLKKLGINLRRFKTGTPARIDGNTIDYSKTIVQKGDEKIVPFSFSNINSDLKDKGIDCYLSYTNEKTHKIILDNINRSPLYNGSISGVGPRYCPSIETKIMRFKDKERHQLFLEPEGANTNEVYVQGMSTSLPEDVQIDFLRSIPGLENCEIMRLGYAIEYDCIDATLLNSTLEFKDFPYLYSAGQFNGSSGYEEAAAQGLIAGINAAHKLQNKSEFTLDRSEAYIGVLIDDLVTKETFEPYRMMTSRAEYRLLLRQDNADQRLMEKGYNIGLLSKNEYENFTYKMNLLNNEIKRLKNTTIGTKSNIQEFLSKYNSTLLNSGSTLANIIKRPEIDYKNLHEIDTDFPYLSEDISEQINIYFKYQGYIEKQEKQVEQFKKLEQKKLDIINDYKQISSLRIEAQEKLNNIKPKSLGQASRISGVSPADISVILIYLEQQKRMAN